MKRSLQISLLTLPLLFAVYVLVAHGPHEDDPLKRADHLAAMALVDPAKATITCIKSGNYGDPSIWDKGHIPQAGDRAYIPYGFKVDIDAQYDDEVLTMNVAGWLNFLADRNTRFRCVTTVVTVDDEDPLKVGKLTIGDADARIQSGFKAEWIIGDRGVRDDAMRRSDPMDLTGTLMCHGIFRAYGSEKTPMVVPLAPVRAGSSTLSIPAVDGWNIGDELLFPGSKQGQTETLSIVGLNPLLLSAPLKWDHATNTIGNLTRNVIVTSANTTDITRRGHHMQMHNQDCLIDSALFLNLGRTDALRIHTQPQLDANGELIAGTDDNTRGRYGLHFHIVSGVTYLKTKPIYVTNTVVRGSPKFGLVHHGAYLFASYCIGLDCKGAAFFCENGSEIGAWRHLLAARCYGSGDAGEIERRPTAPKTPQDTANQGFGYQVTPGVEFTDCEARDCYMPVTFWNLFLAFDMHPTLNSWYLKDNLDIPTNLGMERGPFTQAIFPDPNNPTHVAVESLSYYCARFKCGGCRYGPITRQIMGGGSVLQWESTYINDVCWNQAYTKDATLQDSKIQGSNPLVDPYPASGKFEAGNAGTMGIHYLRDTIEGYGFGPDATPFGDTSWTDCKLRNMTDIRLTFPSGVNHTITNCEFQGFEGTSYRYPKVARIVCLNTDYDGGGLAAFKRHHATIDGEEIIADIRLGDSIPFPVMPENTNLAQSGFKVEWIGLTNKQLFTKYGLWCGGYQIPDQVFKIDSRIKGGRIGVLGPATDGTVPPPPPVKVPDVVTAINTAGTTTYAKAKTDIEASGLKIDIKPYIPVTQTPTAGSMVPAGTTIVIK